LALRNEVTSARELARRCGASEAHMTKVCQMLSRRGLLVGRRGARGGFALAGSPSRVRLLDVYTAIEGPVTAQMCLFRDRSCAGHAGGECIFARDLRGVEAELRRYLEDTTLAEIAARCAQAEAA
jgi:Rrf2 family protein